VFFVYIVIVFVVLWCIAAMLKSKRNAIEDTEVRESISKIINIGNTSNEKKCEMLLAQYKILEDTLPTLERSARTIEQFAQLDRIKRNMKIIMEEYKKLKEQI